VLSTYIQNVILFSGKFVQLDNGRGFYGPVLNYYYGFAILMLIFEDYKINLLFLASLISKPCTFVLILGASGLCLYRANRYSVTLSCN
jgi:hypothetical protein